MCYREGLQRPQLSVTSTSTVVGHFNVHGCRSPSTKKGSTMQNAKKKKKKKKKKKGGGGGSLGLRG